MSKTSQAIASFYNVARQYIGKEIELESGQPFFINYDIENSEMPGYSFQYGFPQSGCVSFTIITEGQYANCISKLLVTAPPASESALPSNDFDVKEEKVSFLTVRVKFSKDMGLVSHTTFDEVEANPNALKMIEVAVSDLEKAKVLGDIEDCYLSEEKCIPVGRSR